jgi:hypothetical protein
MKQRGHLFTFLYKDEVEGTNNRAERAIRPGVIMRKIYGGCNRSIRGSEVHQVIASIVQTCRQQGKDYYEVVKEIMRSGGKRVVPLLTNIRPRAP